MKPPRSLHRMCGMALCALAVFTTPGFGSPEEDAAAVAALDTAYQAAVEKNDAATMDRILHEEFTLVLGSGKTHNKADLLESARSGRLQFEVQAEEPGTQKVRVLGDTAVVTALLRLKGTNRGEPIDFSLWFSDTYVRTEQGWKYFFGQASLPLPAAQK